MAHRDAYYRLAGLIEMDDTYFGSSKPGKGGRRAGGKATVGVAGVNSVIDSFPAVLLSFWHRLKIQDFLWWIDIP